MILVNSIISIFSDKYIYNVIKYDKLFLNIELLLFICLYKFWLLYIKIIIDNKNSKRLL